MRNEHTSPFEMCEMKFHIKLPIFVARQMVRHRTANINEISGRYTMLNTEFFKPEMNRIKGKGKFNKQGSEGNVSEKDKKKWLELLDLNYGSDEDLYSIANISGISNELSRINLPVSTYTEWYWKCDVHNILHFLKLRMNNHAQEEIRVYAYAIATLVQMYFPVTMKAFEDYILYSQKFSKQELKIIKDIAKNVNLKDFLDNNSEMSENEKVTFMNIFKEQKND